MSNERKQIKLKKVELPIPIGHDKPDRNGRVFSREVLEKAFNDPKFKNGEVPVVISPRGMNCSVDPSTIVGFTNGVDLDRGKVSVRFTDTSILDLKSGDLELGIRGTGNINSENIVENLSITSLGLVAKRGEEKEQ